MFFVPVCGFCGSDFVKGQLSDTGLPSNPVEVSAFLEIPVKVPRILRPFGC